MKITTLALSGIAGSFLLASAPDSSAALIASEGFSTTSDAGNYTSGSSFNFAVNRSKTAGTIGFSSTNVWDSNTSAIRPLDSINQMHSGLVGSSFSGGVEQTTLTSNPKNGERKLSDTTLASTTYTGASTYFLSGTVAYSGTSSLLSGDINTMGFFNTLATSNGVSFAEGFHLGLGEDAGGTYLAAAAGGTIYNLGAATAGTLYQIILRLGVSASGTETLTAWYAADGASSLTVGLAATAVETWTSTSDLQSFVLQNSNNGTAGARSVQMDEMRFGTTLADVTSIPEPSTALLGALGFLALLRRRR